MMAKHSVDVYIYTAVQQMYFYSITEYKYSTPYVVGMYELLRYCTYHILPLYINMKQIHRKARRFL